MVGDRLSVRDGAPVLEGSPGGPGEPFLRLAAIGGPIRFGAGAGPAYVLGLRVTRTFVALTTSTVFPVLVRIPARAGDCDYVGTIHLHHRGDASWATVSDDFDRDAATLARGVHGCVPAKNLAAPFDVGGSEAAPAAAAARSSRD